MTDFDLDRLGDVWRQQPDPAEMEALRRTAEAVAKRARRAQLADAALAIFVSAVVLALALSSPRPATLLIGGAAIALMLYTSIRQRRLRKLELESLGGSAEEMLDQSIDRLRATVKRTRLGMISMVPAFAIGIGFGAALDKDPGAGIIARFGDDPWAPLAAAAILIAVLTGGLIHYYRTFRRDRSELERLTAMRDAFRQERENSAA